MLPLSFRLRASLMHLSCSAIIAGVVMAVIFLIWHPGAIAPLQGVDRLVMVLISVDVVLGPLMTLILFNPRKAQHLLRLDLGVVVFLQLLALAYGLVTIFNARPVYVVFNIDRFTIVTAAEIVHESLQRGSDPAFTRLPLGRPRIIAARLPEDPAARTELMFSSVAGGADIYQYPELFVDYQIEKAQAVARSRTLGELKARNDLDDAQWHLFLSSLKRPETDLAYLPVEGNGREGVAVIDRQSGDVVKLVDLYPDWG